MGLWKMLSAGRGRRKAMDERVRQMDREIEEMAADPEWRRNVAAFHPSVLTTQISKIETIPFNLSTMPGAVGGSAS